MSCIYRKIRSTFWTGETGREIRAKGPEARVVATYLLTCASANMIGLYYLPMDLIAHETGLTRKAVAVALRSLGPSFARYDDDQEVVFVLRMAAEQIGESLAPNDKRRVGVLNALIPYRKSCFYADFLRIYGEPYGLGSPPEAPSMPPQCQEQEQDQDQDQDQKREQEQDLFGGAASPPPPTLLVFPCHGEAKSWGLLQSDVDTWQALYPSLNIVSLCRDAWAWIDAHPQKRKTARGMKAFLVGWFSRQQNNGGRGGGPRRGGIPEDWKP